VILTANALVGQEDEYLEAGFDSFLSKPIMTEKLDAVLVEYVKNKQPPEVIELAQKEKSTKREAINSHTTDGGGSYRNNIYVLERLRKDFANNHRTFFSDITRALETEDLETAHLLAHTLKGLAMLIHEPELSQISADIESTLKNGEQPPEDKLVILKDELTRVVENIRKTEISGRYSPSLYELFGKEKALALINELIPMLEMRKNDCVGMVDDISKMPETAVLVRQIKKYKFKAALESAITLKAIMEE
jgi:HPt (histidine-containing phosphotransfer) domain-containing protein